MNCWSWRLYSCNYHSCILRGKGAISWNILTLLLFFWWNCSWWGSMPPILGVPSWDKRRTCVPSAFQLRLRAAIAHRRRYQGAHLEGVSQVQPWPNPLNSSLCRHEQTRMACLSAPYGDERQEVTATRLVYKWPPLIINIIIASRGLSMATP